MVFNATFNNDSAISLRQFYWWSTRRKPPTYGKSLTNESNIEQGISKKYDITDNANYVYQWVNMIRTKLLR